MDADGFFGQIEDSLRKLLPSVGLLKIRRATGLVQLSFSALADFLPAVRAAVGVNIAVNASWRFTTDRAVNSLDSCVLQFELADGGLDVRLVHFVLELLAIRQAQAQISPALHAVQHAALEALHRQFGE